MGATNVSLVYLRWGHLPHRSFRALVYMALVSWDQPHGDQPARVYFAGPEAIARALGRPGDGLSSTDDRVVTKVISDLRAHGAITDEVRAGNGRRAEYRIELEAPQVPPTRAQDEKLEVPEVPPQEVPQGRVGGTSGTSSGGTSGTSQGRTRGRRGTQEEQPSPESPRHLRPAPEIPEPRSISPDDERNRQQAALRQKYPEGIEAS